eukprot:COSAG01_NODE_521_length_15963_cov_76.378530_1_plen_281_part_10
MLTCVVPEGVVAGQAFSVTVPSPVQPLSSQPSSSGAAVERALVASHAQSVASSEVAVATSGAVTSMHASAAIGGSSEQALQSGSDQMKLPSAALPQTAGVTSTERDLESHTQSAPTSSVVCPAGALPGTQLRIQAPDGRMLTCVVPEGVVAGQAFSVTVPSPVQPLSSQPSSSGAAVERALVASHAQSVASSEVAVAASGAVTSMHASAAIGESSEQALQSGSEQMKLPSAALPQTAGGTSTERDFESHTQSAPTSSVVCPAGALPGTQLRIQAPDGRMLT